jgi:hypothetical protein
VNAPLITQSQTLATQVVTSGISNSGSSTNTVTSTIQNSSNKGSSDKRYDLSVQQATSAKDSKLKVDNSGKGSSNSGPGGGGSSGSH